jgi:uncharacterized membrane protein
VRRAFPNVSLARIEAAIADGETRHRGQVRFAVEPALPLARVLRGVSPRERALEVFGDLRIWDTEENCGVLVYLLLADRDVEIIADRGINAHVGGGWETICRRMEAHFARAEYETGAIEGVRAVGEHLQRHFPAQRGGRNELPDQPVVL